MSKLDLILLSMVEDHILFGADSESDEVFAADLRHAKKEIKDLLYEYVGASDIPDWDNEYSMCNTCDFQPTDDTQNCICVFRNQLKNEIKVRLEKL